ncbi:MAG TPA: Ig-like domain-containing protein, partial [Longimicrobiaceae bacterium]|nr:Ig-like domain-containing protein [Longimicrobiaceae bacterium]
TVATAWNQSSGPESCLIAIQAQGWGETYVVASANGISDSVLVKVTNTGYRVYFSDVPTASVLVGSDARVTATVVHQDGTPVPGQSVVFDIGAGKLDSYRAVTDSAGKAAVTWTAPTRLRGVGGSHTLRLLTQFPNGSMATASVALTVSPGPPVTLEFYRWATWQVLRDTLRLSSGSYLGDQLQISVVGRDEYGNLSGEPAATLSLVTLSGGSLWPVSSSSSCDGTSSTLEPGSPAYRYCYSRLSGYSWLYLQGGTHRLFAYVPGRVGTHLDIVVQ